jgi:hypothetical protein
MVLTLEDQSLRQDVALRSKHNRLDENIHDVFVSLVQMESECYLKLQSLKQLLHRCYDFDVYDCFHAIDTRDRGYIDYDSLRRFLIASNHFVLAQDCSPDGNLQQTVIEILRRLNKHTACDRVTYETFAAHFKAQNNYIEQFSPRRLEQSRTECTNVLCSYHKIAGQPNVRRVRPAQREESKPASTEPQLYRVRNANQTTIATTAHQPHPAIANQYNACTTH